MMERESNYFFFLRSFVQRVYRIRVSKEGLSIFFLSVLFWIKMIRVEWHVRMELTWKDYGFVFLFLKDSTERDNGWRCSRKGGKTLLWTRPAENIFDECSRVLERLRGENLFRGNGKSMCDFSGVLCCLLSRRWVFFLRYFHVESKWKYMYLF